MRNRCTSILKDGMGVWYAKESHRGHAYEPPIVRVSTTWEQEGQRQIGCEISKGHHGRHRGMLSPIGGRMFW